MARLRAVDDKKMSVRLIIASALLAATAACAPRPPILLELARAPQAPTIVIIESKPLPIYEEPLLELIGRIDASVWLAPAVLPDEVDVNRLAAEIRRLRPSLLVVFGTPAARFARAR